MTHEDSAVAAQVQQRSLGVAEGPGNAHQLLLGDTVDVRAAVGDGQSRRHQCIDQHIAVVGAVDHTETHKSVLALDASHRVCGLAHLTIHRQHAGEVLLRAPGTVRLSLDPRRVILGVTIVHSEALVALSGNHQLLPSQTVQVHRRGVEGHHWRSHGRRGSSRGRGRGSGMCGRLGGRKDVLFRRPMQGVVAVTGVQRLHSLVVAHERRSGGKRLLLVRCRVVAALEASAENVVHGAEQKVILVIATVCFVVTALVRHIVGKSGRSASTQRSLRGSLLRLVHLMERHASRACCLRRLVGHWCRSGSHSSALFTFVLLSGFHLCCCNRRRRGSRNYRYLLLLLLLLQHLHLCFQQLLLFQ
mmetsp:Transcript_50144/g.87535  ORF Transcript_50144/g.87535 Transcript_50144/m.87535 type:complete len:359 (-) Transcript_50144:422-1498(-)